MSFKLARAKGQSIPRVREKSLASGSAFNLGTLLVVNGSNEYAECGADPDTIAAVAESGAGTDTSIGQRLGKTEFPPGKMQGTWVGDENEFRAKYVGALPAADGGQYGVIKDSDGDWKVDFNETVNVALKLVDRLTDSPLNVPEVIVVFLPGVVQVI